MPQVHLCAALSCQPLMAAIRTHTDTAVHRPMQATACQAHVCATVCILWLPVALMRALQAAAHSRPLPAKHTHVPLLLFCKSRCPLQATASKHTRLQLSCIFIAASRTHANAAGRCPLQPTVRHAHKCATVICLQATAHCRPLPPRHTHALLYVAGLCVSLLCARLLR